MASIFSSNVRNAILQIRAGKMTKSGTTVTADPRKGVLALVQQPSGTLDIVWEPEGQPNATETRSVVGKVTVDRVTKCKTGRVFVVDFNGDHQLFFWLQERTDDRDAEYLKTLKKHIEKPVAGSAASSQQATGRGQSGIQMSTLQNILTNLGGPSDPAAANASSGSPALTLPAAAIPTTTSAATASSSAPAPSASAADVETIDLQRLLLSPQLLEAVRRDPEFYLARVGEHLPPSADTDEPFDFQIRNPQSTAAIGMLQAALADPDAYMELARAFQVAGGPRGPLGMLEEIDKEPKNPDNK